mmetsp:Transcript_11340/g.30400  ORF Transcript_11340/g.30400 Transcript_11340/m.30400 type:complete len:262 (-) Transcript_11340:587-1372(-)
MVGPTRGPHRHQAEMRKPHALEVIVREAADADARLAVEDLDDSASHHVVLVQRAETWVPAVKVEQQVALLCWAIVREHAAITEVVRVAWQKHIFPWVVARRATVRSQRLRQQEDRMWDPIFPLGEEVHPLVREDEDVISTTVPRPVRQELLMAPHEVHVDLGDLSAGLVQAQYHAVAPGVPRHEEEVRRIGVRGRARALLQPKRYKSLQSPLAVLTMQDPARLLGQVVHEDLQLRVVAVVRRVQSQQARIDRQIRRVEAPA